MVQSNAVRNDVRQALILYDTKYGNTEKITRSLKEGIEGTGSRHVAEISKTSHLKRSNITT